METGLNAFKEALHLKHVEAGEYSPLALAYIGDAVYELAIRTLVMNRGNMQVNKMHKKTANLVKADAQARFYLLLEEELTDAEKAAYRRGRNAKSFTMPKHATMKDYRMATGFEALMGYLYLTEQFDRAGTDGRINIVINHDEENRWNRKISRKIDLKRR